MVLDVNEPKRGERKARVGDNCATRSDAQRLKQKRHREMGGAGVKWEEVCVKE